MTEQASTIKHQCAVVFTLMKDGSTAVSSVGEHGDHEAKAFTDKCVELLREIIAIAEGQPEGDEE